MDTYKSMHHCDWDHVCFRASPQVKAHTYSGVKQGKMIHKIITRGVTGLKLRETDTEL